jgi:hypothetical protein
VVPNTTECGERKEGIMSRFSLLKPLVAVVIVAGLLTATLLTATAASEGRFFSRSATAQNEPSQSGAEDASEVDATNKDAPRAWVWFGVIGHTDLEGSHFYLKSERCGTWALLPANDEVAAKLKELHGQRALIVGQVSTEPNVMQRPTVKVALVTQDRSELPDNVRVFPRCQPKPEPRPYGPPMPDFMAVLKRLGLQGLWQVPPGERFEHFLDAEVSYYDANGQLVTTVLTAGVVLEVGDAKLAYDPNGPETSVTVEVGADTLIIRPGPDDTLQAIERGDKVLVLQINGRTAAIVASDEVTVWPGGLFDGQNAIEAAAPAALRKLNVELRQANAAFGERMERDARLLAQEVRQDVKAAIAAHWDSDD